MLTWYKLQEMADPVLDANDAVTGHIISTTIGGKNGEPKQVILLYWMTWENSLSYEIYWKYKIIETELLLLLFYFFDFLLFPTLSVE